MHSSTLRHELLTLSEKNMKLQRLLCVPLLSILLSGIVYAQPSCPAIEVCFTPAQTCVNKITAVIAAAQRTILLQAYSFTSWDITNQLIAAKKRGVDVQMIADPSWFQYPKYHSSAPFALYQNNIPLWIDYIPQIAHNKVMIIDAEKVITGSYNFTMAAENVNTENLLIIDDQTIAKQYTDNWYGRLKISEKLPDYNAADETGFENAKSDILDKHQEASKARKRMSKTAMDSN